jgi:uncharacterized protein YjbJ (UPF0337 family)
MSDDTFRWVVAGGVTLAGVCCLVVAIAMMFLLRTMNRLKEKIEPLAEKTGPVLDMVRSSAVEVLPRIAEVSIDAVEISKSAREQVNRVGELLKDLSDRAMAQVARIDGAVEQTVGSVQVAGESVKDAVLKPVREVNGVLAGIKTAISVYSHGRRQSVDHATQDEEMFI